MTVDTRDFIQRTNYLTGKWDDDVAKVLRNRLSPGDLFVDVGANIGYFSLLAASRGARVIAFEPNPSCHAILRRNAALNKCRTIDARPIGLSDHCGPAVLYVERERNVGAGSLRFGNGRAISISLDTLDFQLGGAIPKLVKIDVEGAEIHVLKGASHMLGASDSPDVLLEVSEFSLRHLGGSKDELFEIMSGFGYQCEIVPPVKRSNATETAVYFQYDTYFTKPPQQTARSPSLAQG